jgi:hypothetical protein
MTVFHTGCPQVNVYITDTVQYTTVVTLNVNCKIIPQKAQWKFAS